MELKKLKINDKLITSNAELKNCINTNILKVPKNVRLIIHGNSTRKALWDTKLGLYSEHISPLPICLGGVKAEGGIIGEMILYVVHQHPNSFVEHTSSGDGKFYKI